MSEKVFNRYLKRMELQADYYSGVWVHHVQNLNYLDEDDIEETMNAAQGYIVPDRFTHGTSEQRTRWFYKSFKVSDQDL